MCRWDILETVRQIRVLFFEIDHSGSWHYEIGDQNCHFYLAVSGPTEIQSHWSKNLKPGDSFTTVPVAVGVGH